MATTTNPTIQVVGGTGFDTVIDVRSGARNGTNIACADATGAAGTEVVNLSGLTIGTTYLFRVYRHVRGGLVRCARGALLSLCREAAAMAQCPATSLIVRHVFRGNS